MFIYIHIRNCFLSKPHLPIIVDSCKRRYLLREAQSEKHTSQFHYSIEKKTALSIFRRFIMQVIIATFKVKVCPHSKCTIKKKMCSRVQTMLSCSTSTYNFVQSLQISRLHQTFRFYCLLSREIWMYILYLSYLLLPQS